MPSQQSNQTLPAQEQDQQPGREYKMTPAPEFDPSYYKGSGKLKDKVAIITGGDSGIGRAVAILFAREGAKVSIVYLEEEKDAQETKRLVEQEGSECLLLAGDLGSEAFCKDVVNQTLQEFGQLDIVVNNAAEQHPQDSLENISAEQLEKTFRTNIFAYFYLTKAALPHLKKGSRIINTTSVTAYRGSKHLLDYSSTKGAIVAFTRSLSGNLADKGILVNGVAPGPIWTPLIPSTFPADHVATFGGDVPLGRPGQPEEVDRTYDAVLFYNNLINSANQQEIQSAKLSQSYQLHNFEIRSTCPESLNPEVIYIVSYMHEGCDMVETQVPVNISALIDSNDVYRIYGDTLCSATTLPNYPLVTENKLNAAALSDTEFCQTFFTQHQ
jgi:NAD(P)-dependent dehydrogenase (short-subunit alcohol dehydrogenase family)